MTRRKSSQTNKYLFYAVVAVIFVCSFFVLFSVDPEQVSVKSPDGLVGATGTTSFSNSVRVEKNDSFGLAPFVIGSVYSVELQGEGVVKDLNVIFNIDDSWGYDYPIDDLSIFEFDSTELQWKELSTWFDLRDKTLEAKIDLSGKRNLGVGKHVGEN